MVATSRIVLLGGLRIEQGGRVITRFRTQKTAALLAYLAYHRQRSHPREQLIDMLWPEVEPASGRNSLSIALSSLRHQLEPPGVPHGAILRADRSSIQLNPEAVTTDVAEFEQLLQKAAQAGSTNERILFLAGAVELYGGELLPGFYEEWCLTERQRLTESFFGSLHQLVEALERTGDLDRALGYARRAVSADPLREESHQDVMRLLAAAGQPTAALRQYRELEQLLDEQLGEAPSATTRELARQIERQMAGSTAPGARDGAPASGRAPRTPHRARERSEQLPTGTVTFLLTDLEGSTAQWEKGGEAFTTALASHHTMLRRTFRRFGGYEVQESGDGFIVAFERAGEALACAVASQRDMEEHPWPEAVGPLRVRMALHTGDVELHEGEYHGLVLHHASRMLGAGHGGQILSSEATAVVAHRKLEAGIRLTDLGVYRLRDVETPERLFQVEYPEMAQRVFSPLRAEAGFARNLPLQFTRFIGRERELRQLEEMLVGQAVSLPVGSERQAVSLPHPRLVTLTGPGGTGKSRLALELAGRLAERFHGAVWFVALADLSDPRLILDAILQALRIPRSPSLEPLEQVVEMLSRQPSLLVLDNFEHLVEEGAPVVQTLLERVPSLKCMVTSRQLLGLSGEREFVVPALQTPASAENLEQLSMYESVQLFIDRAQVAKPDFQVTNQNAAAVAELCNRLEGIPLALELAAARSQVLTPRQMLHQLARRFEFLVSRKRDGAKRHQTLHAAVDWSYRLLSPELQRFFSRLSVFRGGWSLEAAAAVCEEPLALDYLAQLRECSLVLSEEDGAETRFRMLETLREYGAEQLEAAGETETLRRQHMDFFLALAELEEHGGGASQKARLDRLEREHDNLRAALAWPAVEGRGEAGLRLGAALMWFWDVRGYLGEARERLARLLALPGAQASTASRAKVLQGAGIFAARQGEFGAARALLGESLAIFRALGDNSGSAGSLGNLGHVALDQGEYEAARALFNERLAIFRELGNKAQIAYSLSSLASEAHARGEYGAASALYKESLAIHRERGDKGSVAWSLTSLGSVALRQGEYGTARELLAESLAIFQELESNWGTASSLYFLGRVALSQSDYPAARALLGESLAIFQKRGHMGDIVKVLEQLAAVAAEQAQLEWAARLFGAAEGLREVMGAPLPPADQADYDQYVATVPAVLGEAGEARFGREADSAGGRAPGFAAAWAEGRTMPLDQAVAHALEHAAGGEPGD